MDADTILFQALHRTDDLPTAPKYKQTDVGVIPNDWAAFSIGELFDHLPTASNSRAHLGHTGTVSYVHYGDIHTRFHHFIDFSSNEMPCLLANQSVTVPRLRDGDLIVADASEDEAGVGKSVEIRNLGETEAVSGLHTFLLRAKNNKTRAGYRGYLLESPSVKMQLRRLATGLKVFGISRQALRDIRIPLPPLSEQRAIAEALSDMDGLLQSQDALIGKKRAIKQAVMQQLLTGKTRLPGFSGAWETRQLGNIASFFKGSGLSKSDLSPDGKRRCILYGELFTTYGERITKVLYGTDQEGAFFYSIQNDVLIPTSDVTPNGLATASCIPFSGVILGSDILVIRVPEYLINGEFLAYAIKIRHNQVMQLVSGTTVFHLYGRDMANFKFSVPNMEEQTAIVSILSDMDVEIAALERRRDKTRALKQGMMQQLLTGKVRLVESAETTTRQVSTTSTERNHNWQFNEAVVIAVLTKHFGDKKNPLSRTRYTKLSYLLHRHSEGRAEGYLKKAAGPYNPSTRYGGPEKIALTNDYVCRHKNDKYSGFIVGENVKQAEIYFAKWYGEDCLKWLNQFRYEKRDELELLTTVDLAVEELREAGKAVSVEGVKKVIHSDPAWKAKLNRSVFSNTNITRAIEKCRRLFGVRDERPKT